MPLPAPACVQGFLYRDGRTAGVSGGLYGNGTPAGGFPAEIAGTACSVFDYPSPGLKNELAAEVLSNFMSYYRSEESCADEYRDLCLVPGKEISVIKPDGTVRAYAEDIDDSCGLVVRYEDGSTETLRSGEISIRL